MSLKGINEMFGKKLSLCQQSLVLTTLQIKAYGNNVGKGENVGKFSILLRYMDPKDWVLTLYHTIPTFNDPEKDAF